MAKAVKNKELIVIYGDYDADGICATAVLWEVLYKIGAKVFPFIPLREEHGYGLKPNGLEALVKEYGKPELIITVDNGIVAFEGAKWCQKQGIDLIISDHHQQKKSTTHNSQLATKYPQALAIIHTDSLAGVGVAWFLAREIEKKLLRQTKFARENLELAALGTVADMMPLLGINRSLVKFGLVELKITERPGLRALLTEAQVEPEQLNTYNISFVIAPRLNAMGRLGHALDSLRLLCTQDDQRAIRLAVNVGSTNRQRQNLTFTALRHAEETLVKTKVQKKRLLFVSHESYSHGIIGLVAGKLVEKFWRPTVVIAKGKELSKGSVRSIPGVDIISFLRQLEEEFVDLGGHPMAAGFTIETAKIPQLQRRLEVLSAEQIVEDLLFPALEIESEISLEDVTWPLQDMLQKFEPFGLKNKRPVFAVGKAGVIDWRVVGREARHVKMRLGQLTETGGEKNSIDAIFFNGADKTVDLDLSQPVSIAFQVDENEWDGKKSLQLIVKEVRQTDKKPAALDHFMVKNLP